MEYNEAQIMSKSLVSRVKVIGILCIASILLLTGTVLYGLKGLDATAFLIQRNQISAEEVFQTVRFWFWAIVAAITNYVVIFASWYVLDKRLVQTAKKRSGG